MVLVIVVLVLDGVIFVVVVVADEVFAMLHLYRKLSVDINIVIKYNFPAFLLSV